ncbi:hypothetical protein QN360_20395 [Glaciimonas sp. CA11.2]|uniref:hypothetical protein n=1 Tax=Glaciimonas sp. CA11.2 TaxID=3048601 RepID=UPI002B228F2B|nr:hypothetical protein [Glaciimonas sp. CA11.2]MEB0165263.1 hypothetical protein [Glaciimonas sp. CA11.2]
MRKSATEVSKCSEKGGAKIKFEVSPRCKQQSRSVKIIKTCLAFVLKRPVVFRWAIVHLPDAIAAVAMWAKEAISYVHDIF